MSAPRATCRASSFVTNDASHFVAEVFDGGLGQCLAPRGRREIDLTFIKKWERGAKEILLGALGSAAPNLSTLKMQMFREENEMDSRQAFGFSRGVNAANKQLLQQSD